MARRGETGFRTPMARLKAALLCSTIIAPLTVLALSPAKAGQLPLSAFQTYNPANAASIVAGPFALFQVPVNSLQPTQFNVGFAEVGKKTADFNLVPASQLTSTLLASIEPVVIGPGGVLFQTNGHHSFTALTDSIYGPSNPTVFVNVIANFSNLTQAQFFAAMETGNFFYPVDNGVIRTINLSNGSPLPTSLSGLTNDPYRTLEFKVLKNKSSVLFPNTNNITGAVGSSIPGNDKTAAFFSDFIWADAYRAANNGLGQPFLTPTDIAIATNFGLNANNKVTLPGVSGQVSVAQIPGYILPKTTGNITITGAISNATLANGVLDGTKTGTFDQSTTFASFAGLNGINLGQVTVGISSPGFVLQLGADNGSVVTLSGNNTYTGGTTILAGTLVVANDQALGAAPVAGSTVSASNGIVFNSLEEGNGTLRFGTAAGQFTTGTPFITARPISVNGEVAVLDLNGNVVQLNGQISSAGGNETGQADLSIQDNSGPANGVITINSNNSAFFGNIILSGGTLQVASDTALGNTTGPAFTVGALDLDGGTFKPTASFTSSRTVLITSNSTFDTNGQATTFGKLSDDQRQMTITNSNAGTAGSVTFGSFDLGSTVPLTINGGSGTTSTTVTFTQGINRIGSAVLILQPSSGTLGTRERVISGVAPAVTNGIVSPFILVNSGAANNSFDFAAYDPTNGFEAFSGYTSTLNGTTGSNVVKLSAVTMLSGSAQAFALNVQKGDTLTVGAGNTLTLGNGTSPTGLILNGGGTGNASITAGTLAFGASEGIVTVIGTNVVSSQITGSGGLTIAGSGTLQLNTATTQTGAINVESGTLTLGAVDAVKTSAAGVFLSNSKKPNPATLNVTANNQVSALNSAGNNSAITLSNGAKLTIGDSQNLNSVFSSALTETGTAVTGALTKVGTGLLDLTGVSKGKLTFVAGSTVAVNQGQLRVAGNTFKNATGITVASGAELQFAEGGGSIFAGPISGAGNFHLMSGTLNLTGANTYTGTTTLETGSTLVISTASLPSTAVINAGGLLEFDQTTTGTFSGVVSDGLEAGVGPSLAGSLVKDDSTGGNSGNVTLSAAQTYTGATFVEAGTLTLGATNTLATSSGVDLGRVGGGATASLALTADNTIQALQSEASNTTTVQTNGHTLTLNLPSGTGAAYGGSITGGGPLVKSGAGTQVLNGATAVSSATVSGGILAIGDASNSGAALTGNATVGATGTLMGHGTITGAVSNSGTVLPGGSIGTLSISGTFTQAAAGTLTIQLNPTTSSLLAVSGTGGTASLAGTIAVQAAPGSYSIGHSYQVVTATGGVSGTFATVTNPSGFVFNPVYQANEVDLVLSSFAFDQVAHSPDQQGAANLLNNAPAGSGIDAIRNAIGNLPRGSQAQALDQLNPHTTTALKSAGVQAQQGIQNVLSSRVSAGGSGQYAGYAQFAEAATDTPAGIPRQPFTVWGQAFAEFSSIRSDGNAPGTNTTIAGAAAGIEKPVDADTNLGVAFGYANSALAVSGVAQNGNLDAYALNFYGNHRYGRFQVDGSITAAYDQSTTNRFIGATNSTAQGVGDGFGAGASGGIGYRMPLGWAEFMPRFAVDYNYNHQNGFTEGGASAADLTILGSDQNSLRSTLGGSLTRTFALDDGSTLAPEFHAGWSHEWLDIASQGEERFAALQTASFTTTGINVGRDAAVIGGGLTFAMRSSVSFYATYEASL